MPTDTKKCLTYVLANGYEKTVTMDYENLLEFVKWFHDANSSNTFDLSEEVGEQTTFYKDAILSIRY